MTSLQKMLSLQNISDDTPRRPTMLRCNCRFLHAVEQNVRKRDHNKPDQSIQKPIARFHFGIPELNFCVQVRNIRIGDHVVLFHHRHPDRFQFFGPDLLECLIRQSVTLLRRRRFCRCIARGRVRNRRAVYIHATSFRDKRVCERACRFLPAAFWPGYLLSRTGQLADACCVLPGFGRA